MHCGLNWKDMMNTDVDCGHQTILSWHSGAHRRSPHTIQLLIQENSYFHFIWSTNLNTAVEFLFFLFFCCPVCWPYGTKCLKLTNLVIICSLSVILNQSAWQSQCFFFISSYSLQTALILPSLVPPCSSC